MSKTVYFNIVGRISELEMELICAKQRLVNLCLASNIDEYDKVLYSDKDLDDKLEECGKIAIGKVNEKINNSVNLYHYNLNGDYFWSEYNENRMYKPLKLIPDDFREEKIKRLMDEWRNFTGVIVRRNDEKPISLINPDWIPAVSW